jgi:hypothetical protein
VTKPNLCKEGRLDVILCIYVVNNGNMKTGLLQFCQQIRATAGHVNKEIRAMNLLKFCGC